LTADGFYRLIDGLVGHESLTALISRFL